MFKTCFLLTLQKRKEKRKHTLKLYAFISIISYYIKIYLLHFKILMIQSIQTYFLGNFVV